MSPDYEVPDWMAAMSREELQAFADAFNKLAFHEVFGESESEAADRIIRESGCTPPEEEASRG